MKRAGPWARPLRSLPRLRLRRTRLTALVAWRRDILLLPGSRRRGRAVIAGLRSPVAVIEPVLAGGREDATRATGKQPEADEAHHEAMLQRMSFQSRSERLPPRSPLELVD